MATLRSSNHPAGRMGLGETVLERTNLLDTTAIAAPLASFVSAHRKYTAADKLVRARERAQNVQEEKAAEAELACDTALHGLAAVMISHGAPRAKPFGAIGFASPAQIIALGSAKEATCHRLAKTAGSVKGASTKTKATVRKLGLAVTALTQALKPVPALQNAKVKATLERDALGGAWEAALIVLKRATRTAEAEGSYGLFAAIFRDDRPERRQRILPPPLPNAINGVTH
jgi:hypothetical protein